MKRIGASRVAAAAMFAMVVLTIGVEPAASMPAAESWAMGLASRTSSLLAQSPSMAAHTVGLVDPARGFWYLRAESGDVASFYFGNPGDVPMVGDWDCDGSETPGLYRPSDGYVYLRNTNDQGIADISFFLGNAGDEPLAGDFDGDGCDTVSVYRPSEGRVFVVNELAHGGSGIGDAEYSYYFGNPGDKPFVGDFNGNGEETIGLHRESTGLVYLRQSHTQGIADVSYFFGDPGDRFVAGDWTGGGVGLPGLFRPSDTTFYFRSSITEGVADSYLRWGEQPWLPVAGAFGLDPEPPPPDVDPPPPPEETIVFTAAGDIGATDRTDRVLDAMSLEGADFHLAVGDLSYADTSSETEWCSYIESYMGIGYPFQLLVGNHEDDGDPYAFIREFTPCLPDWMDSSGDYGVEYFFDVGPLRVVMIAADISVDGHTYDYSSGADRDWLLARIDEAESEGRWTVVGMHKNCITAGVKSCEIGETMMNDMISHGVDLVLQGHEHNYQRSHQLGCVSAGAVPPECLVDTDSAFAAEAGTVLAITGWVGRDGYDVDWGDQESGYFAAIGGPNTPAYSEGYLTVSVSNEDLAGVWTSVSGTAADSFVIRR